MGWGGGAGVSDDSRPAGEEGRKSSAGKKRSGKRQDRQRAEVGLSEASEMSDAGQAL